MCWADVGFSLGNGRVWLVRREEKSGGGKENEDVRRCSVGEVAIRFSRLGGLDGAGGGRRDVFISAEERGVVVKRRVVIAEKVYMCA
jgi:hypothetical protein